MLLCRANSLADTDACPRFDHEARSKGATNRALLRARSPHALGWVVGLTLASQDSGLLRPKVKEDDELLPDLDGPISGLWYCLKAWTACLCPSQAHPALSWGFTLGWVQLCALLDWMFWTCQWG